MSRSNLYILAFLEGFLVMLLELTVPHALTPIIGNSLDTWAVLIALSFGGLAVGYFLGAKICSLANKSYYLFPLFSFSAISLAIGTVILIYFSRAENGLSEITFSGILCLFSLLIPTIFLGATTPILVDIHGEKSSTGNLFSTSTFGGVFSALITGTFLLPQFGIITTFIIAVALLSFLLFLTPSHFSGIKKYAFVIPLLVVIGFNLLEKEKQSNQLNVLHFSEGLNGQLLVLEQPSQTNPAEKDRLLLINRMGQTWVNASRFNSLWSYANYMTSIASIKPKGSKTLILGLGGGVLANQVANWCGHQVKAVDLDEKVIDLAKEFFNLSIDIETFADDARHYLNQCQEQFDVISMDIFSGEIAPSHVLSKEAFEETKRCLKKDGILVINFNGFLKGEKGKSSRALLKTLLSCGFKVQLFATTESGGEASRNTLFIAYFKEPAWDKATITVAYKGKTYFVQEHFIDLKKLSLNDVPVITDDNPQMEVLNRLAAQTWRENYLKNITLKYRNEEGLPVIR